MTGSAVEEREDLVSPGEGPCRATTDERLASRTCDGAHRYGWLASGVEDGREDGSGRSGAGAGGTARTVRWGFRYLDQAAPGGVMLALAAGSAVGTPVTFRAR